ncbi:MAG: GGDEF domain-containing protein [Planctomycetota bacterium]|nr:GGDEF domain-containing protein [Planctomycetota bacterium]MDP6762546.1 GGDEF domain-containing protein [Planctomycetota bacterium]MDP6990985.1 GGDEF domain-containing protein [Planctomycetota bacterium]
MTTDEILLAQTRTAATGLEEEERAGRDGEAAEALAGWEVREVDSIERLADQPPAAGDVILLDKWLRGDNVYEACRSLTGRTQSRIFIIAEHENEAALSIASFCGAAGTLHRPVTPSNLRDQLEVAPVPRPAWRDDARARLADREPTFPEKLLVEIATGRPDVNLVNSLVDPQTSLFNFAFLNFKLDEEFKRAKRFGDSLSCVMLGFEGQAGDDVLRDLAGLILEGSRDTDVLGRFDESSFLFLLPRTAADGAGIMARRVGERAQERALVDLVGDPLVISVGISCCPHPDIREREDLYRCAREAFVEARAAGGGVIACT